MMRDLKEANRVLKLVNEANFHGRKIFTSKKTRPIGDLVIEAHEIEEDGECKITLTHHKKAQAIADLCDVGMMITVDVNHKPYYYFY